MDDLEATQQVEKRRLLWVTWGLVLLAAGILALVYFLSL
jgi:hypothetical protein